MRRERFELQDGDFLDLDWAAEPGSAMLLVLHGLEGSSRATYAQGMMAAALERGWGAATLNFRGCSGSHNRLDRSYHSGETGDIDFVVRVLRRRYPQLPLAAVGFSLGGNALLKWLGETGDRCPLDAAAAVSVPLLLDRAAARMNRGLSRLYQWRLIDSLRRKLRDKYAGRPSPMDLDRLADWQDFHAFDDNVTAPLHGFDGAAHYYRESSSRQYLARIAVPTLVVHALDDPFMYPDVVPGPQELSAAVHLQVSARGGHVGFVEGGWPLRPRYWLERAVPEFLAIHLGGSAQAERQPA